MTYWEILGVEPGADEKTVRRAYAARLKAIDQMTEPEAFQALRHAYEVMLAHARYLSSAPEPVVREEASSSGEPDARSPYADARGYDVRVIDADAAPPQSAPSTLDVPPFDAPREVSQVLSQPDLAAFHSALDKLLTDWVAVDARSELNMAFLEYAMDPACDLERVRLLERRFGWKREAALIIVRYGERAQSLFDRLDPDLGMARRSGETTGDGPGTSWIFWIILIVFFVSRAVQGPVSDFFKNLTR